jgi:hypothetical protein
MSTFCYDSEQSINLQFLKCVHFYLQVLWMMESAAKPWPILRSRHIKLKCSSACIHAPFVPVALPTQTRTGGLHLAFAAAQLPTPCCIIHCTSLRDPGFSLMSSYFHLPFENTTGSLLICYLSFRNVTCPAFSRIPSQFYTLSNDTSRPTLNAITHE